MLTKLYKEKLAEGDPGGDTDCGGFDVLHNRSMFAQFVLLLSRSHPACSSVSDGRVSSRCLMLLRWSRLGSVQGRGGVPGLLFLPRVVRRGSSPLLRVSFESVNPTSLSTSAFHRFRFDCVRHTLAGPQANHQSHAKAFRCVRTQCQQREQAAVHRRVCLPLARLRRQAVRARGAFSICLCAAS